MSGGSYDYVCYKIDAIELRKAETDPRRMAFQKLLKLVGEAMHDIEWVDSGDYGEVDDNAAIDKCFAFLQTDSDTITKARAYDGLVEMLKSFLSLKQSEESES